MEGSIATGTQGYNMEGWGPEQPKELRPQLRTAGRACQTSRSFRQTGHPGQKVKSNF